eukprot:3963035-Heterocapsa_arctica.AAC.1
MDWINQAAGHTDPDPDLWENWKLEKRANAKGSNRYGREPRGQCPDANGDIDMGWDYHHNEPERRNWETGM